MAMGIGQVLWKMAAIAHPHFFFRRVMEGQRGIQPACIISFDCDFPRDIEVLPTLVPLLQRYGISASFACVGDWVRQFPGEHQLIADAGFEILNHTETHPNLYHPDYDYARVDGLRHETFNRISPAERREEIERGHATIAEILGVEPVGFRTPHFGALHVDDVYPMLSDLGYRYSSSFIAGKHPAKGRPFKVHRDLWEVPLSPCPRHPFGVFDSWHSLSKRDASHCGQGDLSGLFAQLLDLIEGQGGLANVYFDPCDMLHSGEMERILSILADRDCPVLSYGVLLDRLEGLEGGPTEQRGADKLILERTDHSRDVV